MALEEKGMALGKRGMARRHGKRGWGKHYCQSLKVENKNSSMKTWMQKFVHRSLIYGPKGFKNKF